HDAARRYAHGQRVTLVDDRWQWQTVVVEPRGRPRDVTGALRPGACSDSAVERPIEVLLRKPAIREHRFELVEQLGNVGGMTLDVRDVTACPERAQYRVGLREPVADGAHPQRVTDQQPFETELTTKDVGRDLGLEGRDLVEA